MSLKYVKCRTILVFTKKIRPRSKKWLQGKLQNDKLLELFIAVRSIAADLKARRFEGHLRTEKLEEES